MSGVECVEALTIVLAIGSVRGWRSALGGSGIALILLLAIVAAVGPALARIPIGIVQITVGTLLLLFGMRWLRKAILRAVGVVPLHDETAAFAKETARLRALGGGGRLDMAAALATNAPIRLPYCTGAVTPSGNAARVCAPQAAQRQSCARCSVTSSGWGSGRSNTCRATWAVVIAAVNGSPHAAQDSG
jgi:hypothetical protein